MTAHQASQPSPLDQVLRTYDHDPEEYQRLLAFLTKHPIAVEVLLDAQPHLKRIFNPNRMVLDLVVEPEDDDLWKDLFCLVEGNWEPEAGLRLLKQFDEEWWSDKMQANNLLGVLNFDVEFSEDAAV